MVVKKLELFNVILVLIYITTCCSCIYISLYRFINLPFHSLSYKTSIVCCHFISSSVLAVSIFRIQNFVLLGGYLNIVYCPLQKLHTTRLGSNFLGWKFCFTGWVKAFPRWEFSVTRMDCIIPSIGIDQDGCSISQGGNDNFPMWVNTFS